MKLSELIVMLEQAKRTDGDTDVYIENTRAGERTPIKDICLESAWPGSHKDGEACNKRVVLL